MIEEAIWFFLGVVAGTITGLLPGVHANTVALIVLYSPIQKSTGVAIFIVSMSITHSFVDSIPSIFLGAASEESSINTLPGHEMLLRGEGLQAIRLTVFGGLLCAALSIPLMVFFYSFAQNYTDQLPAVIPSIIVLTILLMILREKKPATAATITVFSGSLGVIALGSTLHEPVFVLVTGFFALPSLLDSLFARADFPEQKAASGGSENVNFAFVSSVTSGFLALLPGIGPAQAAAIVNTIAGKISKTEYLVMSGGINSGNLIFSLLMLFAIGKTRTGMAVALDSTIEMDFLLLALLLAAAIASAGIGAIITEAIAQKTAQILRTVNYSLASLVALCFLFLLIFLVSGVAGIAAAFAACCIASAGKRAMVQRSHCMSFLLIPALLFYLGF